MDKFLKLLPNIIIAICIAAALIAQEIHIGNVGFASLLAFGTMGSLGGSFLGEVAKVLIAKKGFNTVELLIGVGIGILFSIILIVLL